MDYQKLIRTRRSIRGYRPDPIPEDVLGRVLDAARIAPTAANRQPFQLIVVTEAATRALLKEVYDREWFWTAPPVIVGCAEEAKAWQRADGFNAAEVDLSIVMDHLILSATDEGLGTCWICHVDERAAGRRRSACPLRRPRLPYGRATECAVVRESQPRCPRAAL